MNSIQEMTENLDSIRDKIVKTDIVLKVLGDKSKNLSKVEKRYSILLAKYAEKNEEIELWMKQCETIEKQLTICNTTHSPLQNELTALKTRYESLEQTHHVYVNAAEIKYQSSCQQVLRLSRTVGKLTKKIEHLGAKETIQFGNVKKLKSALRVANVKLNASVLKYEELIANNKKTIAELEAQYKSLEQQRNTDLNHLAQIQVECEQLKKSIQKKSPSKKDSEPAALQKQIENFQRELKCSTDELKLLKFSHENDIKEITKKYELENKLLNDKLAELKIEKLVRNSASQTDIDDCYNFTEILSEMITYPELVSPCSPNDVDTETKSPIIAQFKETSTQTDQHFRQVKEYSQSGPFRINENTADARPDKQRTTFRTANKVRKNYKTTINKLLRHVKNGTLNTKRILDDVLAASSPIVIVSPRILKSYLNDNAPKLLCHKNGDMKMNNKMQCFHHCKHRNEYYCCLNDCKLKCCGGCLQSKHCCCKHNCNCCSRGDNQKEVNASRDYHRNINGCSYNSDDDQNMKLHLNRDLHLNDQTQPFDSSYMKHMNINDHLKHKQYQYDDGKKIKSSASSVAMCNNHDCSSKMDTTSRNYINETFTSPNLDSNKLCYCNIHSKIKNLASYNMQCSSCNKSFDNEINPIPPFHQNPCNKECYSNLLASSRFKRSKYKNKVKQKRKSTRQNSKYFISKKYRRILYSSSEEDNDQNTDIENMERAEPQTQLVKRETETGINVMLAKYLESLPLDKNVMGKALSDTDSGIETLIKTVKSPMLPVDINSSKKQVINTEENQIDFSSIETLSPTKQKTDKYATNQQVQESFQVKDETKVNKIKKDRALESKIRVAPKSKLIPRTSDALTKNKVSTIEKSIKKTDSLESKTILKTTKIVSSDQQINPKLTNTEEENHIHSSSIELSPDHSTTKQKTNKNATNTQVQVSESFQVRDISVNETQNKDVNKIKKHRTLESEIRENKSIKETVEANKTQSTRNKNTLVSKTKLLSKKRKNTSANAADYKKMKLELFGSDIEFDTISEASELENSKFSKTPEKRVAHKSKPRLIPKTSDELTKNKVSTIPKLTVEKVLVPKVLEMKPMFKQPVKVIHNSVVESASVKENMPLDKEKVEELDIKIGRKLVADIATLDWNKELMETVVNCLVKQESNYVARLIVNQVALDYSQQFDRTFTPPAPLMTITQRKLLVLMVQLEQNGLNNIQQSFLNIAEQRLLSETKVEAVHPITRLYVAICKLKYDIEQVRMLCCNAAYHMGDLLLPLMFIILTMWGDVLPMAQNSADIHLATVLVHIIHSKSCKIPGYNFKNLGKLLNDYYGYKRGQSTTDEVFTKLVAAYSENCSKLVYISILILCKNQPSKWTYKQISTHFIPIITDNMKLANRSILVSMTFILVSRLVETFDANLDKDSIKGVHDWLCQFIRDNAVVSTELRKSIETCLSVFFRIFNT